MNPHFAACLSGLLPCELEIEIRVEADEFWSYVGNKKNQRWTWYALERNSGVVIAWHNGRRTDESCSRLMEKISVFPAARFYTDDWKSCQKIYSSFKTYVFQRTKKFMIMSSACI
ncbi:MAG: IS1 family transposase [Candidatus Electronema sp. V4]|uniref:IS1 family transposase n=1 Tax=Candidatus Electronema sp. V4 TaxID=3454756 RepID=UPI0040553D26